LFELVSDPFSELVFHIRFSWRSRGRSVGLLLVLGVLVVCVFLVVVGMREWCGGVVVVMRYVGW
jgi:hypothetical protein